MRRKRKPIDDTPPKKSWKERFVDFQCDIDSFFVCHFPFILSVFISVMALVISIINLFTD